MRKLPLLLVPAVSAAVILAGCTGNDPGTSDGDYAVDGTFTMATTDSGVFDPLRSQLIFDTYHLAYDSLLNLQPDGEQVSGLAVDWSATTTSAEFVLAPDITCSDGTELTASHVATVLSWIADPANGSPHYGTQTPTLPMTITGDDATRTVTVTLDDGGEFGFLLNTIGQVPIVCPAGFEDPEIFATGSSGTGPFELTEVVPGQSYTFTRRDGYTWGPNGAGTDEPGFPKTVVLSVVENDTTAANLLLSGELNFARVSDQDAPRVEAAGLEVADQRNAGAWLWLNQIGGRPSEDPAVREALIMGLDLDEIIQVSTGGTGSPATGLMALSPKICDGDNISGIFPDFDPEGAGALLDEAGWVVDGDGRSKDGTPLVLDLHYQTADPYGEATAELISQRWGEIGVGVTLSADAGTDLSQVMFVTSNYDVYIAGFGSNLPSQMIPYLSGPIPADGGVNLSGIQNEEYLSLTAEAGRLTAPESCDLWNQAEKALFSAFDLVPISDKVAHWYLNKAEAGSVPFHHPIPTSIRVLN